MTAVRRFSSNLRGLNCLSGFSNELRIAGTVRGGSVWFLNCHIGFAVRRFGNGFPDVHDLSKSRFAVFDSVPRPPVRTGSSLFTFGELRIAGAVRGGSVYFFN